MTEQKDPKQIRLFNAAKLLQTDKRAWKWCSYPICEMRETCLGGPRGSCARTGGWPVCSREGQNRIRDLAGKDTWEPSETYYETSMAERMLQELQLLEFRLQIYCDSKDI